MADDEQTPKTKSAGLKLKVMVYKQTQRVAFAEANAAFVDTLFSFLTLPLGTILKTIRSRQPALDIGCTNNLYSSVERLDPAHFFTTASKIMLLHPKNAALDRYRRLEVKVDDDWDEPTMCYLCPSNRCECMSFYEGTRCACRNVMTKTATLQRATYPCTVPRNGSDSRAFVKEMAVFVIGEGFRVMPISTSVMVEFASMSGIAGKCDLLQERAVSVEVLQLLVALLRSKTPLKDLLLDELTLCPDAPFDKVHPIHPKEEMDAKVAEQEKEFQLKLVLRKSTRRVLYAEVGSNFVDLIFSFLTYPLGAIVKLLGGSTPMQGLNTLYDSVRVMSVNNHFKSDKCKEFLVHPKLPPYFNCESQLLKVDEEVYPEHYARRSCLSHDPPSVKTCSTGLDCKHRSHSLCLRIVNPKSLLGDTMSGGPFTKPIEVFMVTDDLVVTPFSATSVISLLDRLEVPIWDVEEKVVNAGKTEVLNLLKASLRSNTPLTDVFSPVVFSPWYALYESWRWLIAF